MLADWNVIVPAFYFREKFSYLFFRITAQDKYEEPITLLAVLK